MYYLLLIVLGLVGNAINGNTMEIMEKRKPLFECINPTVDDSRIPKCCNATNYKSWFVNLKEKHYNWHLGVGVILNRWAVLTLADRISNVNSDDIVVSACEEKCQEHRVSKLIVQPSHFTYIYSNFAILILSTPLQFNTDVGNICWTDLSHGMRSTLGFKYFPYLFHQESYQEPRRIIAANAQNRDIVLSNRTVNLIFSKNMVNNKFIYHFMGFETNIKYDSSRIKGNNEVNNQYIWPNFFWINQILQQNLNKTDVEDYGDNVVKKVSFKLKFSKNTTSDKVDIKVADVKPQLFEKLKNFKVSANQI